MRERFASVDSRQAFFNFPNEPVVITQKTLNRRARQSLRVHTRLSGEVRGPSTMPPQHRASFVED